MPTLMTNDADGFTYAGTENESWLIAPNVVVGDTIMASSNGARLTNYGTVLSDSEAVRFSGGTGHLYNREGGVIEGWWAAFFFTNGTIHNEGALRGYVNSAIAFTGYQSMSIVNAGLIDGEYGAISVFGQASALKAEIRNSGTIVAEQRYAIEGSGATNITISISNSGRIDGGELGAVRFTSSGAVSLVNSGRIDGVIVFESPTKNDTIINTGTIAGSISLGGGHDNYRGGGKAIGIVDGEAGNDILTGGAGADVFIGGVGKDTLRGGGGNDLFRFLAIAESTPGANADRILDFDDVGNDRIDLSLLFGPTMAYRHNAAFTGAGQVRINDVAGADVIVEVNTGGSLAADFAVRLVGTTLVSMTASDFVL